MGQDPISAPYLVFTNRTQGNVLNNFAPVSEAIRDLSRPISVENIRRLTDDASCMFSQNDTVINVARFCFGLNMFTTLPLELFVCREVRISPFLLSLRRLS